MPVLLEREIDLRTLAAQIDGGCAGAGSLTLVEGPAGIGKTSLLDAACGVAADRGMRVLQARGGVLEQNLEYGVVRQLLEPAVVAAADERRRSLVAGPAAPAAAVLG